MYHNIFTTCFLLFGAAASSQTGSIHGTVTDRVTRQPLSFVTVQASSSPSGLSNDLGLFYFNNMAPGSYALTVTHVGYKTEVIPVVVRSNGITTVTARMEPAGVSLPDVVLSAKKAAPLHTLAAVDIRLRPLNNAQEVLRMVPGLFIAQHAGGGKAEQIFLRGYDTDHGTDIHLSVDGMPVNMVSHAHGQGYSDLHFLIPETVEKVAFNYGPYAVDKGNMATAGFAAFETREALPRGSIQLEGGQFGTGRAVGLFPLHNKSGEARSTHWYAASEYYFSDGYFESPQRFRRRNFFTRYTHRWNGRNRLSLQAGTFGSSWNASGQVPERAVNAGSIGRFGSVDPTEGGRTGRTGFSAKWTGEGRNRWHHSAQLYSILYYFGLYSNFTFFLKDPVNGDQVVQRERRNVWGYNGAAEKSGTWAGMPVKTGLGYGFRADAVRGVELALTSRRRYLKPVQSGDVKEGNAFLYLQQDADLTGKLHLNLGLRYDHFRFGYKNRLTLEETFRYRSKGVFSPKATLTCQWGAKATLFAAAGTGFHSNDTRVILNREAQTVVPAVFGADAGALFKPAAHTLLKLTLWHLRGQQEFVYVGDEGVVEPGGRSQRMGADLSVRYQVVPWLFADADATICRAEGLDAPKGKNYLPLAPTFTATGGLSAKAKSGFSGSLRCRFLKDRPANETGTVMATGYFLADALLRYGWRGHELFISADNLLNSRWREAQFDTESRLPDETLPVSEIHFTPGSPRFVKAGVRVGW